MTLLWERRRALMAMQAAPEPSEDLYEIGTDVVAKYCRSAQSAGFEANHTFDQSTGAYISGSDYASADYIEVDPDYTLTKSGTRMQRCCWYDADKVFISSFLAYNTRVEPLDIPRNARYLRVSTNSGGAGTGSTSLQITRTA